MKSVLITGASSGIGHQLALDYAADGWHVIACGRSLKKLSMFLNHPNIVTCCFDATDAENAKRALSLISAIDLVILNAGTCEYVNQPNNLDVDLFKRVFNTNVFGTLNCLSIIIPKMKKHSTVAIVSSIATQLPFARAEAYGGSKAALDYIARSLYLDLKPQNIQVSLIRPGFVKTPLTDQNDFPMPSIISVEKASSFIRKGLAKNKVEIAFPGAFIFTLKLLSWLPNFVWHRIAQKMQRHAL